MANHRQISSYSIDDLLGEMDVGSEDLKDL